ncbi:hypothetical protein CLOSBL3_10845 [Clostridiaceae bacterium BL-3]|jgi:hypothetical protein|nr:hypothetical protein CLOSBL3_10845 [Clostridiaceae bacterium BL-3]
MIKDIIYNLKTYKIYNKWTLEEFKHEKIYKLKVIGPLGNVEKTVENIIRLLKLKQ